MWYECYINELKCLRVQSEQKQKPLVESSDGVSAGYVLFSLAKLHAKIYTLFSRTVY